MTADRKALVAFAGRSIAKGSRSFALASRLFEPQTRERAWLLYAWCRHADDLVDGQEGGRGRVAPDAPIGERLAALREGTQAALARRAEGIDAYACLAAVVEETGMPEAFALQHLDGFAMDAADRTYRTIGDTLDYCYHVAGVVGAMMAVVMGVRPDNRALIARAVDLGLAFQLTNIVRDVRDDAAIGRCYLPAEWLTEAGIPPGEHMRPEHRGELAEVAGRMLDLADAHYASAREGALQLPRRSASAVLAAAGIYQAIGDKARAAGSRAWDRRQHTSAFEKLRWALRALATARQAEISRSLPPRAALWSKP